MTGPTQELQDSSSPTRLAAPQAESPHAPVDVSGTLWKAPDAAVTVTPESPPSRRPARGVGPTLRSIRDSGSRIPRPHMPRPHMPRIRPSSIRARVHTFESFKYRNYRLMWGATAFSSGAFWLQQVIIGWIAYDLTKSAFLTTLAMGLDALPILIVGPVGGLLADSWDRRKLLAGVLAYQCAATVVFGVVVMLGQLETWHIFAYIIAMGFAFVILDPTRMTIIASSVPSNTIVNAFALNSLGFSVMRLAAPAVGGGVLALWGAWPALMLEAALHLVAVAFALALSLPVAEQVPLRFKSAFSRIAEGARYVRSQPVILGICLMGVLMPLLGFTFVNGLMPVYAAEVFFVDSVGLGLLMASIGAGSTLGTLVLASFSTINSRGRLLVLAVFLTGVTMMLFSRVPTMQTAIPMLMLVSASTMLFFSTASATIQSLAPEKFRGRVASLYALSFGALPVGSLLAGVLAQQLGAPTATLLAGAFMLVALLVLALLFRSLWRLR